MQNLPHFPLPAGQFHRPVAGLPRRHEVLTEFLDAWVSAGSARTGWVSSFPGGARHRPGRLIGSLAVMLTAGGEHVSDLDILRASPEVFGQLPSNATVSGSLNAPWPTRNCSATASKRSTRELRSRAWDAAGDPEPGTAGHARGPAHHRPGCHPRDLPLGQGECGRHVQGRLRVRAVYCQRRLRRGQRHRGGPCRLLRPGNAGANSADDHIRVFEAATAQLPGAFHDAMGRLAGKGFWSAPTVPGPRGSSSGTCTPGAVFTRAKAHMIDWINDKTNWQPALDQARCRTQRRVGHQRHRHHPPDGLPARARTSTCAPSPCTPAHSQPLDLDGHRITAFLTNSPRWHGPFLDARHRARGRCENRIKTLKNTGLGKLPFFDFAANQAWANIAALAGNLVSWLQLTALPDGHHARNGTSKPGATGSSRPPGKSSPAPDASTCCFQRRRPSGHSLPGSWKPSHTCAPDGRSPFRTSRQVLTRRTETTQHHTGRGTGARPGRTTGHPARP